MDIAYIESKLASLRLQLEKLETEGTEKILNKRIEADMGDDFRENEGAKLVMEDHNLLHLRVYTLKKEIFEMKKILWSMKRKGKS